jgi:outer membrane protein OmpA-like peptidoglycan-associated protein
MKSLLMLLALGGTAVATPGPDFIAADAPKPVHKDLAASNAANPIEPTDIVAFASASTTLLDGAQVQIDRAAAWLQKHPGYNIVLEGHTDVAGAAGYNETLALGRADAVRVRLQERGISPDRIVLVAWGEEQASHPRNLNDRRVVMYATRASGKGIAADSLKRGALRAAWYANGSRFDMLVQGAL